MAKKAALFGGFVVFGGGSTAAYVASQPGNEEFLFMIRDISPGLVNLVAPLVGLPMEEGTGKLDTSALPPQSVADLVGETVTLVVQLSSGRIACSKRRME